MIRFQIIHKIISIQTFLMLSIMIQIELSRIYSTQLTSSIWFGSMKTILNHIATLRCLKLTMFFCFKSNHCHYQNFHHRRLDFRKFFLLLIILFCLINLNQIKIIDAITDRKQYPIFVINDNDDDRMNSGSIWFSYLDPNRTRLKQSIRLRPSSASTTLFQSSTSGIFSNGKLD